MNLLNPINWPCLVESIAFAVLGIFIVLGVLQYNNIQLCTSNCDKPTVALFTCDCK